MFSIFNVTCLTFSGFPIFYLNYINNTASIVAAKFTNTRLPLIALTSGFGSCAGMIAVASNPISHLRRDGQWVSMMLVFYKKNILWSAFTSISRTDVTYINGIAQMCTVLVNIQIKYKNIHTSPAHLNYSYHYIITPLAPLLRCPKLRHKIDVKGALDNWVFFDLCWKN